MFFCRTVLSWHYYCWALGNENISQVIFYSIYNKGWFFYEQLLIPSYRFRNFFVIFYFTYRATRSHNSSTIRQNLNSVTAFQMVFYRSLYMKHCVQVYKGPSRQPSISARHSQNNRTMYIKVNAYYTVRSRYKTEHKYISFLSVVNRLSREKGPLTRPLY